MNHTARMMLVGLMALSITLGNLGREPWHRSTTSAADQSPIAVPESTVKPGPALRNSVAELLAAATAEASHISGPGRVVAVYQEIAQMQAELGDAVGSLETMRLAEAVIASRAAPDGTSLREVNYVAAVKTYTDIAKAAGQAKSNPVVHEALKMANTAIARCGDTPFEVVLHCWVAESQAATGDMANACRAIEAAKLAADKCSDRNDAYQTIAISQAKMGQVAGAKTTAMQLTSAQLKVPVYLTIVASCLESGDLVEAKATATQIEGESYQALAYRRIAETCVRLKNTPAASEALKDAVAIQARAQRLSAQDDREQWGLYGSVAVTQVKMGDMAEAMASVARIEDDLWRWKAYCWIAVKQAQLGDITGSHKTLATVKTTVPRTDADRSDAISNGYQAIAEALAEAGDFSGANKAVSYIDEPHSKSSALRDVVLAQLMHGDIAGARQTIAQHTDAVDLHAMADAQAAAGDIEGAEDTVSQIADESERGIASYDLAVIEAVIGDIARSKATAKRIVDVAQKAGAYHAIARAHRTSGNADEARLLLEDAKTLTARIKPRTMVQVYLEVAITQARFGDPRGAIALIAETFNDPVERCESLIHVATFVRDSLPVQRDVTTNKRSTDSGQNGGKSKE